MDATLTSKQRSLASIAASAQAGLWDEALAECRRACAADLKDLNLRALQSTLAGRVSMPALAARAAAPRGGGPTATGGDALGERLQNSRRISDVLHEAATRHLDDDVAGLLAAARAGLAQDLPAEALRLCQKVVAREPGNEEVRGLLREISRRQGL